MKIDDSIISGFLSDNEDYVNHWLFYNILDNGAYTFEKPNKVYKAQVKEIYLKICSSLTEFIPYNLSIFNNLFPDWKMLRGEMNIILAVGCPSPYDAMVREYEGVEYIIFDLIRFLSYEQEGSDVVSLIQGMITHEFAHICIHNDYPDITQNYIDKLKYITFDEGFAHLLSLTENLFSFDFTKMIADHYNKNLNALKSALLENNNLKQNKYLVLSNSGKYWDKFAAISGKLYLALNLNNMKTIYHFGPSFMVSQMI